MPRSANRAVFVLSDGQNRVGTASTLAPGAQVKSEDRKRRQWGMANVLWGGQAAAASLFSMAGQVGSSVFFKSWQRSGLPRRQQRRTDGAAVRSLLVKVCADSQITNLACHCVKTALNNGPMRLTSPRCPLPPPSRHGISFNMLLV
jgi:hypothetical protein